MVHAAETKSGARGELIERWDRDRQASPGDTRIILTHTNDEVRLRRRADDCAQVATWATT